MFYPTLSINSNNPNLVWNLFAIDDISKLDFWITFLFRFQHLTEILTNTFHSRIISIGIVTLWLFKRATESNLVDEPQNLCTQEWEQRFVLTLAWSTTLSGLAIYSLYTLCFAFCNRSRPSGSSPTFNRRDDLGPVHALLCEGMDITGWVQMAVWQVNPFYFFL